MRYYLDGRQFNPDAINFDMTADEVRLKTGARLISGHFYALGEGYGYTQKAMFVGKIFEKNSCWNGGEVCTYTGKLLFAVERAHDNMDNRYWEPTLLPSSRNVWGDWSAWEKKNAARITEEKRILKQNAELGKKLATALAKLDFPGSNGYDYVFTRAAVVPLDMPIVTLSIGQVLKLVERKKK